MNNADVPKVLVMLKQKPLILHLLHELEKINQLAKPIVVVGYQHTLVRGVLGDSYEYAYQEQQLGTAHAVTCADSKIRAQNVLVLYGDMPFIRAESLKELIRYHHGYREVLTMFTSTVPSFDEFPSLLRFGRIIRNVSGQVVKITEYKDATPEEQAIREVNPGIYMFNTDWLRANIGKVGRLNVQGEFYLTDMVEVAIRDGHRVRTLPVPPAQVLGVNSPEELQFAERVSVG